MSESGIFTDANRDYFYEDELPNDYPYDLMFDYSWVDGVRLFPKSIPYEVFTNLVSSGKLTVGDSEKLKPVHISFSKQGWDHHLEEVEAKKRSFAISELERLLALDGNTDGHNSGWDIKPDAIRAAISRLRDEGDDGK